MGILKLIYHYPTQLEKISIGGGRFFRTHLSEIKLDQAPLIWKFLRTPHCQVGERFVPTTGLMGFGQKKRNPINYLELLAVFHGLRCFASHLDNSNVLLRVDNSAALSYINRMGSIKFPYLSDLTKRIWSWCAERDLFIYASYIPSAQNFEADAESRVISVETEWSLDQSYFDKIDANFGHFDIDLFATSNNAKCPCFVSWFPDPLALSVDAFSLDWGGIYFYAFPPFILILRVLRKIISDKASGVVVVPWWPTQPWFPLFNRLIVQGPVLFEPDIKMLIPFQEDTSSVEQDFPGSRSLIR